MGWGGMRTPCCRLSLRTDSCWIASLAFGACQVQWLRCLSLQADLRLQVIMFSQQMSRRLLSSLDNHFGKLLIELLLKGLAIRLLCGNRLSPAVHSFLCLIKVAADLLVHLFPDDLGAFAP